MSDSLKDLLAKYGIVLPQERLEQLSSDLETATKRFADLRESVGPSGRDDLTNELQTWFREELHRQEVETIKATAEKPSPELIERARQQINQAEIEEMIRRMKAGDAMPLYDFIDELEQIAAGHE